MGNGFLLDGKAGYFRRGGVDVMAFDDFYPAGHQSGVSVIMHAKRIATNGDVRFEPTPGQWQPLPKQGKRVLSEENNSITTSLSYPDADAHLKGFNPMIYPDCRFDYCVTVKGDGNSVIVSVDINTPLPKEFDGRLCFNLELFPGEMFSQPWIMDNRQGIFPRQPNGPVQKRESNFTKPIMSAVSSGGAVLERLTGNGEEYSPIVADDYVSEPYAEGHRFTLCPDDPLKRMTVESKESLIRLYDGRMNHNNGWFVLSSQIPEGAGKNALIWRITPNCVETWKYGPVIQISQVGYHPNQPKVAVIETDKAEVLPLEAIMYRVCENGEEEVCRADCESWGAFLRYDYLKFDFSDVKREGLYKIRCGDSCSEIFRIAEDVYDRGVWQPVLEYFLPVQMCHMRVNEKYRVWHGRCHEDDARMAPLDFNHIDGYVQGKSTLTKYKPGEHVPGLNVGGWHDAGDFDLRVESQSSEVYILSAAYEEFGVYTDSNTVDQARKITEIHTPDGRNDIQEQIEHGLLSLVGGYKALGRLYRGIICPSLRQYVLLGDAAAMTDGVFSEDDRLVFTEDNPPRELSAAAHMAAAARAMRGFNDELGADALNAAEELFERTEHSGRAMKAALHAACELFITTGKEKYRTFICDNTEYIINHADETGWFVSRALSLLNLPQLENALYEKLSGLKDKFALLCAETPYGIPYRPHIWGAGWDIQRQAFEYYFLNKAHPELFTPNLLMNALNFILGCHPGLNTASFASGIGTKSATVAYGMNRADWSYIPGGVISGTALIRPDFPELLTFPYLWQQTEYVLGGGSSHYMFLVLAVQKLLKNQ